MTHPSRLLVALLALVLGTGSAVMIGTSQSEQAPVYTVAELQARLVRSPAAWVGQTVRLRGTVLPAHCWGWSEPESESCWDRRPAIVTPKGDTFLLLSPGAPNALLAALGRLPLVGQLVPPPQGVQWGAVATYRVQLRTLPAGFCEQPPCYGALLLDAASGSL